MENEGETEEEAVLLDLTNERDKSIQADLSRDVIRYLSKEIETTTNNMMVFRSKIGFAVIVGPFLILGTLVYAAKGASVSITRDGWIILAALLDVGSYLALAFLAAKIEEDAWGQCDKWRKLIADLHDKPMLMIGARGAWKDKQHVGWMKWTYLGSCALMILSFLSSLYIISRVKTTQASTTEPTTTNVMFQGSNIKP